MEPFTVSLVGALAAGAIAVAKDTASQLIKDVYASIRQYIKDHYAAVRLDELEKEPESKGQRLVAQEKLEKAGAENDPDLPKLVAQLVQALKSQAPHAGKVAGVDLERIHAAVNIQIERVGQGTPVTMKDLEAGEGSIIITDVGGQSKN